MTEPKRHHYLPQFYLEGFTRNGGLWVFDRACGLIRPQTPLNTAVLRHYYAMKTAEGTRDNSFEKELLAKIDSDAKPLVEKLEAGEDITDEQKKTLSLFVAFLDTRVPDFEQHFNAYQERVTRSLVYQMFSSPEDAHAAVEAYQLETGTGSDMDPQAIYNFVRTEYRIQFPRINSLGMMLQAAVVLSRFFVQMDWLLFHSVEPTSFVTTDSPFVAVSPVARRFYGFASKGVLKLLPLSARVCLVMGDQGDALVHQEIPRGVVRAVNLGITAGCHRFVIGRDEALVRSLVREAGIGEM